MQYGPLGVKLWFNGDTSKDAEPLPSKPNRAPEEDHVTHYSGEEQLFNKTDAEAERRREQFYVNEPVKKPETLEEWMVELVLKKTFDEIDLRAYRKVRKTWRNKEDKSAKSEKDIDELLKTKKEEEPDFICKMCNLVFVSRKHYEVHKVGDKKSILVPSSYLREMGCLFNEHH